jgi:hypothetical protein
VRLAPTFRRAWRSAVRVNTSARHQNVTFRIFDSYELSPRCNGTPKDQIQAYSASSLFTPPIVESCCWFRRVAGQEPNVRSGSPKSRMYLFRQRPRANLGRNRPSLSRSEDDHPASSEQGGDDTRASRERLVMATNHMTAFVVIFYGLYAVCRFGFGWDPIRDPPPATYTIEIPGLTTTTTEMESHSQLRRGTKSSEPRVLA